MPRLILRGEIMRESTYEFMKKSVASEMTALEDLYDNMDKAEFGKALDMLMKSGLTITTACGSSGFAAKKFAHALCCIECPAKFVAPSEAVHGGMGALKEGNAIVIVSKGGRTDELLPIINIAKSKKAVIIAVTQKVESTLAKSADVILKLPDVAESDRYGVMSTTSFTATMAYFNALMVGIMEEKDYKLEEFALIHPGGGVGKDITK